MTDLKDKGWEGPFYRATDAQRIAVTARLKDYSDDPEYYRRLARAAGISDLSAAAFYDPGHLMPEATVRVIQEWLDS